MMILMSETKFLRRHKTNLLGNMKLKCLVIVSLVLSITAHSTGGIEKELKVSKQDESGKK